MNKTMSGVKSTKERSSSVDAHEILCSRCQVNQVNPWLVRNSEHRRGIMPRIRINSFPERIRLTDEERARSQTPPSPASPVPGQYYRHRVYSDAACIDILARKKSHLAVQNKRTVCMHFKLEENG